MALAKATLLPSKVLVSTLPVKQTVREDESGQSFLYRTFASNALSFRHVGHQLGIKNWIPLPEQLVAKLSLLCGCGPHDLMQRWCIACRSAQGRHYRFMSHRFGEGSLSVARSARICPICVKRSKYAKAAWLLKGTVGCFEHGILLREQCPRCNRLIRWHRPAIDVCECGHFLTNFSDAHLLPSTIANWSQWLQLRFDKKPVMASDFNLPRGLDGLSLDTCFRLIFAFGLLERPDASLAHANSKARSCEGMSEVIRRGIDRYLALETEEMNAASLIDFIHMPALERLRFSAICMDDVRSITWLIHQIIRKSGRPLDGLGRYPRGQLSLF